MECKAAQIEALRFVSRRASFDAKTAVCDDGYRAAMSHVVGWCDAAISRLERGESLEPTSSVATSEERDGTWLFREDSRRYWRLVHISNGKATGSWIHGEMDVSAMAGELRKPTQSEEESCRSDPAGRLLQ